jgi:hypothetical protein
MSGGSERRNIESGDAPPLFGLSEQGRAEIKRKFLAGDASLKSVAKLYDVTLKDAEAITSAWKQDHEYEQMVGKKQQQVDF